MRIKKDNKLWMLMLLISVLILHSCNNKSKDHADHQETNSGVKYTCPMHPQIVQDKPGICPICKMDLVLMKDTGDKTSVMLSQSQMQLANIKTIVVGEGNFNTSKILNGRLVTNPTQTEVISSRIPGRIEQLFVKETGRKVVKGEPLFQIYSEQLQVLQQDYLLQLKQVAAFPNEKIYQSLLDAARNKLKLFGYSNTQINLLNANKRVSPRLMVYSSATGVVNEINVSAGQYIQEGSPVLRLENLSQLWLEADIYPSEVNQIRKGSILKVIINGFSDQPQNAKVNFVSPALDPSTQRLTIRAVIDNTSGSFQPGMQANVFLSTGRISKAVSLPLSAVIRDENGAHVWVKAEANTFKERKVTTGAEDSNQIVVTSGLVNGEQVVVSGAYLLHSEYVLKRGVTL